jgi:hypothetical protein
MNQKIVLFLAITLGSIVVFSELNKTTVVGPTGPTPPPIVQPPPVEPPPKQWTKEEALNTFSSKTLRNLLDEPNGLAALKYEGRMSGKKGNVEAAKFIKEFHEKNGLKTEYQKFSIKRLNSGPNNEIGDNFTQNIFAYIEGSDPALKDEIIVLGAHMDHIGYGPSMSRSRQIKIHPGADDNGSGTVVVMEVARALSYFKGKIPRTIVFQHYSAEEMGLIGARYYCNNPTFPKNGPSIRKHIAMVNLDMVGYLNRGEHSYGFYSGESSVDLSKIIGKLNNNYSFARRITSRGSGGSDHAPFYNKRIPVVFLHTGSHPYYHTPKDTPDKINYEGMEAITRYTFELIWSIAHANAKPQFNHATFKPMEYRHDHGHSETPFEHSHHHHEHDAYLEDRYENTRR